jgi:hypothetical protein
MSLWSLAQMSSRLLRRCRATSQLLWNDRGKCSIVHNPSSKFFEFGGGWVGVKEWRAKARPIQNQFRRISWYFAPSAIGFAVRAKAAHSLQNLHPLR